jgi:hypothetical protein
MARRALVSTKQKIKQAVRVMIEPLEIRRLLTTWVGGGIDANGNPIFNTYTYTQPDTTVMEASIGGNTTVEAIFYNGTAIDPTATNGDLFQLYVARSDLSSVISIYPVTTTGIEPFSSAAPSLSIIPNAGITGEDPPIAAGPSDSGAGVLGGLSGTAPSTPVVKANINGIAIGVRPAGLDDLPNDPSNDLSAGLVVAPGLSLGKFLFGGEVFGKVYVPGNMNLFYAGWLLTGDARGATEGTELGNTSSTLPTDFPGADGGPVSLADGLEIPRGNFYVGGDLQNLATTGPIGWDGAYGTDPEVPEGDPHYLSGVDIEIGGKLGAITSLDGDASSVHVLNDSTVPEPVETQEELEGLNNGPLVTETYGGNTFTVPSQGDFTTGYLVQYPPDNAVAINPFVDNTFADAQFLGAFDTSLGTDTISVVGSYDSNSDIDRDPNDYYGVPLMAGQSITVQLTDLEEGTGNTSDTYVGVFDPDGNLIATDYDNVGNTDQGQPFKVTATMPGEYRIAIGPTGDINFDDSVGASEHTGTFDEYQLNVTNLGNLAVGGIKSYGDMLETDAGWQKLEVDNGDVGDIDAATNFHVTLDAVVDLNSALPIPQKPSNTDVGTAGIYIVNGNLRSFDCGQIGLGSDLATVFNTYPDLEVPNGSVGLVRARTGILELNPNNFGAAPALVVGGSYEWIQGSSDSAQDVIVALAADGGIGEVIGPNIEPPTSFVDTGFARPVGNTDLFSVFDADADNSGDDGIIDSIVVAGNLVGAKISHGPGGDLRFITVGGTIQTDTEYTQGSGSQSVAYNYNQSVTLTDDSGATVTLTPLGPEVPNPLYSGSVTDPTNVASVPEFGPRLVVETYPLESGGVCIVEVESTGGLQVNTTANGVSGRAEISTIEVFSNANVLPPTVVTNPQTGHNTVTMPSTSSATTTTTTTTSGGTTVTTTTGGSTTTGGTTTPSVLDVLINGSAITDIGDVIVEGANTALEGTADFPVTNVIPAVTTLGDATEIDNSTGGDIVSVQADGIGQLSSKGRIGLAPSLAIPGMVLQFETLFTALATGVTVTGNTYPFVNQTFGVALDTDVFSISAGDGLGNISVANAAVGGGIIAQITPDAGGASTAGIFAGIDGPIVAGTITSVNIGQGILYGGSGSVSFAGLYATSYIGSITNQGQGSDVRGNIISSGTIGTITLNNGAIIDSEIGIITNWESTRQNAPDGSTEPTTAFSNSHPLYQINNITVTGTGGIIGSDIIANAIANINDTGFGIIDSTISTQFAGHIGNITAGGYGIRNSTIGGGSSINSIDLTGNGSNLPTTSVTPSVRESQSQQIDPSFGVAFDPFSGRVLNQEDDIDAYLGTSIATPVINGVTDTGVLEDTTISGSYNLGSLVAQTIRARDLDDTNDPSDANDPISTQFDMRLEFGSIGTLQTRGVIDGLRVVAGTIKKFEPGSDVLALYMTTSGKIGTLQINGSLAGNSTINASGTNGGISKIIIAHDLVGSINVTNNVSSISIGGNLTGSLTINGTSKGTALGKLTIGGSLLAGSLNVTIQTAGSLGTSGDNLTFTGSLSKLIVGHGNLAANLTVDGKVGTIQVNGAITGDITAGTVSGSFQNLIVNGSVDATVTINGKLNSAKITNGDVNESINAVDGINKFTILNGSLAANQSIQSSLGSISSLIITGGDLFGSVLAPVGTIKTINVSNNLGDGIDPLNITTTALNTLSVGSSILSGVKVTVTGPLGALIVGGSIEPGATISATSHRTLIVGGSIAPGSLQIG